MALRPTKDFAILTFKRSIFLLIFYEKSLEVFCSVAFLPTQHNAHSEFQLAFDFVLFF